MYRPPKRLIDRANVAADLDLDLTEATKVVAARLLAGAMHSVDDLRDVLAVHAAYEYDPIMIGAMGGDDAREWAAACLRAAANPRGVDFDRLSAALNGVDEATARELVAAGNVVVERVLERLGRMIKAQARQRAKNQSSEKVQRILSLPPRDIKAALPWSLRAVLTIDEEGEVRRMVEADLRPEAERILVEADARAVRLVADGLDVTPAEVVDATDVPSGVRIRRAADLFVTALSAMIVSRVNRADEMYDGTPDEGSIDAGRVTVNTGIVKDVIATAAGAQSTPAGGVNRVDGVPQDASGSPLRSEGFALSGLMMGAMERIFADDDSPTVFVTEYTWHHNTTGESVREDHARLDGVTWRTPAERFERIGKNSTSQNGCNCSVSSRLVPVPLNA